jgi:hypothetical protein
MRKRTKGTRDILHARVLSIQHGVHIWRATSAKVVKMYRIRNIAGLYIFVTVKVLNGEWSSVIIVKS